MVALSGSFSRSTWFFLIALVATIYRSAGKPSHVTECSQPDSFTVQIIEKEYAVYGTELLIRHNPHVGIFSYPEINPVNVVFYDTSIEFKAYIPQYTENQLYHTSYEKLSWNASGIIFGIGTLQKLSNKDSYAVQDCRLFLPQNIIHDINVPPAIENVIIYYAQSCAEERLCREMGTIKEDQLQNINVYQEYGHNIARIIHPNRVSPRVDLNMNLPVDILLKKVINYIVETGKFVIDIPDIVEKYDIGLGMKCNFETRDGNFLDLSTLKRTENAVMSSEGHTYVIQAGLGLSVARFKYDHYKLKVGLVTVSGSILGTVDGLAIAAKLVINYDNDKCSTNIKFQVTELGKIDLKMTGLGPLNSFTSTALTWLTGVWQDKILKVAETNIKNIAEELLREFICSNLNDGSLKYLL